MFATLINIRTNLHAAFLDHKFRRSAKIRLCYQPLKDTLTTL